MEIFTLQRPLSTSTPPDHLSSFAILLFVLVAFVLVAGVIYTIQRHFRKHAMQTWVELRQHTEQLLSTHYWPHAARAPAGDEQLRALEQPSVESSARTQSTELNRGAVSFHGGGACISGAGTDALLSRTLAHDMILGERVGKSRSGEV